ncbi:MAG: DUF3467 domain-containing protein [Tidjanibacter sp.]|nr:DUF3467 domain-containing protein [Tidjanibacter sp.]
MANEQNTRKLEFELPADVAEGKYSNLSIIAHSKSEFIFDFASMLPGMQKAKVHSRIILTPENAKRLLLSLQENVGRYESNFGAIQTVGPKGPVGGGFA